MPSMTPGNFERNTDMSSNTDIDASRRLLLVGAAALAIGTFPTAAAFAATPKYPSRPIRFVVPFPPGSGTDTTARLFAKTIGELHGQAVMVDNRPGGNGFIGVQSALNAPADGYTIFIGSNSTLATNAATFKELPYDPIADFTPITLLTQGSCLIIVPADSPYKTLQDLVDDAQKRPGELNYASGSISYTLSTEWLNELANMRTTGIPYKGAGDAVNATLAGTVDFAVVDGSGGSPLVQAGSIRALAYTGSERSRLVPDIPTSAEVGLAEYLPYNWVAAAVSASTPPDVVESIKAMFREAASSPEIQEYYKHQSAQLIMSSPEKMREYQHDEIERWARLVKLVGLELQ